MWKGIPFPIQYWVEPSDSRADCELLLHHRVVPDPVCELVLPLGQLFPVMD